jgi:hypothetical protein
MVIDVSEEFTASITTVMMEAVSSSESSVSIFQTTRCNISGHSHLHLSFLFYSISYFLLSCAVFFVSSILTLFLSSSLLFLSLCFCLPCFSVYTFLSKPDGDFKWGQFILLTISKTSRILSLVKKFSSLCTLCTSS